MAVWGRIAAVPKIIKMPKRTLSTIKGNPGATPRKLAEVVSLKPDEHESSHTTPVIEKWLRLADEALAESSRKKA